MNPVPIFSGVVLRGKLTLSRPEDFQRYVATLEGEVQLTVRKMRKDRSSKQNRYYRGVVCKILGDQLGYQQEEMHEIYRMQFLLVDDGRNKYTRSTTKLSTVEMEEYLAKCRMWASQEHQCYIPLPNEVEIPEY